jgi:hypothetical protein
MSTPSRQQSTESESKFATDCCVTILFELHLLGQLTMADLVTTRGQQFLAARRRAAGVNTVPVQRGTWEPSVYKYSSMMDVAPDGSFQVPGLFNFFSARDLVPYTNKSFLQSAKDAMDVIILALKLVLPPRVFDDKLLGSKGTFKGYQSQMLEFVIAAVIYHVFFGWSTPFTYGESLYDRFVWCNSQPENTHLLYYQRTVEVLLGYIDEFCVLPFDITIDSIYKRNIKNAYKWVKGTRANYEVWSNAWLSSQTSIDGNTRNCVLGHNFEWCQILHLFMNEPRKWKYTRYITLPELHDVNRLVIRDHPRICPMPIGVVNNTIRLFENDPYPVFLIEPDPAPAPAP